MKQFFLAAVASLLLQSAYTQVSISNPPSAPHGSAMLEVKSDNRGFLMPRVALRTNVTAPATGLLVYETASNAVWVYNGTAWVQLGSGGGASQWLTNASHIYNGNTGNVGIGTSTPSQKLEVAGDLFINDGAPTLKFKRGSGLLSFASIDFTDADDAIGFRMQYGGGNFKIGRPTSLAVENDLVVKLENGYIGINNAEPEERFDMDGGNIKLRGSTPFIKFEAAQGGTGTPISNTRYVPGLQFLRKGTSTVLGKIEYVDTVDTENFFRIYTGATSRNDFILNSNHDICIGGSNPSAKLEVRGVDEVVRIHAVSDPLLQFTTGIASGMFTNVSKKGYLRITGSDMVIGTNTANDAGNFIVTTNGTESIKVSPSANVGIGLGAAAPEAKLHVKGKIFADASGEAIKIDGNQPAINLYHNGTQKGYIWQTGNNLTIGVSDAAGKIIVNTGQMQIGTSINLPAGYKVGIGGKVLCEELRVKLQSSGWPDYVFSNKYQLMPLAELQKFIQTNNHLPNIPKASVIEKEGLEVGDMQKRLMEKVEELTLYILDLQKQIDELKVAKKNAGQ